MWDDLPCAGLVYQANYGAPIGYIESTLLCPDCAGSEAGPFVILQGQGETDRPSACEWCGVLIPESLTAHGEDFVRRTLRTEDADQRWRQALAEAYPYLREDEE